MHKKGRGIYNICCSRGKPNASLCPPPSNRNRFSNCPIGPIFKINTPKTYSSGLVNVEFKASSINSSAKWSDAPSLTH